MTLIEIGIVVFCLVGCSYSSYQAGQSRGIEIGGLVYSALMEDFLNQKLGKDEADRILKNGLRFDSWLRRHL